MDKRHAVTVSMLSRVISAGALKRGEFAVVVSDCYYGRVVLRTFDRLVFIDNGDGYLDPDGCTLDVQPLTPGAVLTIEVK